MKAGFWPAPTDFCWRWGGDCESICHWVREWVDLWPAGKPNCCRIKKDISVAVTGYYFLSELLKTRSALVVLLCVALWRWKSTDVRAALQSPSSRDCSYSSDRSCTSFLRHECLASWGQIDTVAWREVVHSSLLSRTSRETWSWGACFPYKALFSGLILLPGRVSWCTVTGANGVKTRLLAVLYLSK